MMGRRCDPGTAGSSSRATGSPGARLAGSNKLGQGLLALLSRGDLNEDTWDEIEETLLVPSDLRRWAHH